MFFFSSLFSFAVSFFQEPTRNRSKSFHHTVRVVHPYSAQVEGELTINPGDIIEVVRMDHSGWWEGLCQETGQRGVFPSNFTVIKVCFTSHESFFSCC